MSTLYRLKNNCHRLKNNLNIDKHLNKFKSLNPKT